VHGGRTRHAECIESEAYALLELKRQRPSAGSRDESLRLDPPRPPESFVCARLRSS